MFNPGHIQILSTTRSSFKFAVMVSPVDTTYCFKLLGVFFFFFFFFFFLWVFFPQLYNISFIRDALSSSHCEILKFLREAITDEDEDDIAIQNRSRP